MFSGLPVKGKRNFLGMYPEDIARNAADPTDVFKLCRDASRGYLDLGSLLDKREGHCYTDM